MDTEKAKELEDKADKNDGRLEVGTTMAISSSNSEDHLPEEASKETGEKSDSKEDSCSSQENDLEEEDVVSCWVYLKTGCLYFGIAILFFALLGVIIHQATRNKDKGAKVEDTTQSNNQQGCGANSFMMKDGVCDEVTNTKRCLYDGGDCCREDKDTTLCNVCTCKKDVNEEELIIDFDQHQVQIFLDSNDYIEVKVNDIKTVRDVENFQVCSMICLDKLFNTRSNAWIYLKGNEQCKCALAKTTFCYVNGSSIRLKPFQGDTGYFAEDSVAFIQLDKTIPCGCFYNETSTEEESKLNPNYIEPTNEISPWHCQNECQKQSFCQTFSFNSKAVGNEKTCHFGLQNYSTATILVNKTGWITGPSSCEDKLPTTTGKLFTTTTSTEKTTQKRDAELNKILLVSGVFGMDIGINGELLDLSQSQQEDTNHMQEEFCRFSTLYSLRGKVNGVGGLLMNKHPIFCGGSASWGPDEDDCFVYNNEAKDWENVTRMTTPRSMAAAVVLNDNAELFVIGGVQWGNIILNTTEFVSLNGSRKGPDLLKPLSEACFVKFSDTEAMTIGGVTENYLHPLETFIYSTETEAWSYGPTLDTDEFDPGMWNEDKGRVLNQACGIIVDTESSETYVVTIGGKTKQYMLHKNYAYWKPPMGVQNLNFISGDNRDLPDNFFGEDFISDYTINMVSSQDRSRIFMLGAYLGKNVYQLQIIYGTFEWTVTSITTQSERNDGVAILVPDSICY